MSLRLLILAVAFVAMAGASPFALAQSTAERGEGAAASALRMTHPRLEFREVNATAIDGVYEVITEERILYFVPKTRHLIVGEIIDAQGRSLTRQRQAEIMAARLKDLPLEDGLKIGSGPNVVIEFTDPDCPFCRRGSEFLDQRKDVTRYVFFFPLTRIHPQAEQKSRFVLSAQDPVGAYHDIMAGRYDSQPLPAFTDNKQLERHLELAAKLNISGTPQYWVNGVFISGADLDTMKRLLDAGPPAK